MSKFKLTVGADPEFFAMEGEAKKQAIVMACGRFGGSKGSPIFLGDLGGYLEDGTAVEFNLPTTETLAQMQKNIFALIAAFEVHKKVTIAYHSSASFKPDELKKFPEAMAIGCSPDRFAYGLRSAPSISQFKNRRFAGGHIHLGIDPWPEGLEKVNLIRLLDLAVLIPYQPMFVDMNRYPHYGYPGLYRETSYGVEWRSPDNHWCNPVYIAKGGDGAMYAKQFIAQFDGVLSYLKGALEKQEDGRAINDYIQGLVERVAMDYLSSRRAQKMCEFPTSLRTQATAICRQLISLTGTKEPAKKKKAKHFQDGLEAPFEPGLDFEA